MIGLSFVNKMIDFTAKLLLGLVVDVDDDADDSLIGWLNNWLVGG